MLLSILDIEILIYITISFFDLLNKACVCVCVHLPAEKGFFFIHFMNQILFSCIAMSFKILNDMTVCIQLNLENKT